MRLSLTYQAFISEYNARNPATAAVTRQNDSNLRRYRTGAVATGSFHSTNAKPYGLN